jgi:hypothetical protein
MAESSGDVIYSRNPPFINEVVQAKLATTRLGLVGCGLSSQLAVAALRLGVRQFSLWDGDTVELSNLNRQAFGVADIGANKAERTALLVKSIDASAEVEWFPNHVSVSDIAFVASRCDVVVNSADFTDPVFLALDESVTAQGNWCLQPLNLGLGGSCLVFGPNAPSMRDLVGTARSEVEILGTLRSVVEGFAPGITLEREMPRLLGERLPWYPQNIIATNISVALMLSALVTIAAGAADSITVPRIMHFDPETLTTGVAKPI